MSLPSAPADSRGGAWRAAVRGFWPLRRELRRGSMRARLMGVVVKTTALALMLAAVAMSVQDFTAYREARVSQLTTEASILALAVAPALAFDDRAAAQRSLAFLRAHPAVLAAALYGADGGEFARYVGSDQVAPPTRWNPAAPALSISGQGAVVSQRIVQNGEWLGTIYLRARFDMRRRIITYVAIIAIVSVAAMIAALMLSTALQRSITAPLDSMAHVARQVVEQRDFSLRATRSADDETGMVVEAFNRMLDEVQSRTRAIERANVTLQQEGRIRQQAELALRDSERQYRAIGESIQYGVWRADATGRNTYVSDSFLALLGMTQPQCSAAGWMERVHTEDAESMQASWQESVRSGRAWYCEYRVRGSDALYHPILAQGVPVYAESGGIGGWAGIHLDISRLKATEEALREADRRKDEFVATLAHELRNPLAPIRNAAELLELRAADDSQRQWAREVIARQVKRMGLLLDDLLEVSRITRGRLELRKDRVSLASLIATAIETARPLIDLKHHALQVELPPQSIELEGDPLRLSQAISNLLNNAAKYTDAQGRIGLRARLDGDVLSVTVSDNGIGFEPQAGARLFEMFSQIHAPVDRTEGGLGIGLALVRGLIALHGGTVEAVSAGPGQGSSFTIRLPGARVVTRPEQASRAPAPRSHAEGRCRLLVADDNQDAAESLAVVMRMWGYDVQVAHTGTRALELALRERPDACILDIGMPGLNGYEVARRIRAQPWAGPMLLLAVTGWGQNEDVQRARDSGFDHHMTKPVDLARVDALLLEHSRQMRAG